MDDADSKAEIPDELHALLAELREHAQSEKMAAIGRLSGGVAHDLNNLLTPIIAYGNMLTSELAPGTPAREFADEMVRAGDRIVAMTKTLQSFRVKPGNLGRVDLPQAARAAWNRVPPELRAKVELMERFEPVSFARFEVDQVESALEAVFRNACQAMPSGGQVAVSLSAVADPAPSRLPAGRWIRLAIRDTGCGIAPEAMDHIFEPYFTTRPKGQGKGLGLSVAYAAVCRAGGLLRCHSEPGAGTEVEIYLSPAEA